MNLPKPIITTHNSINVLRDDLIPGGSKQRILHKFLTGSNEFVYASPAYGYAQIALAHTCKQLGLKATIFTAKRKTPHARTIEAAKAGAKIMLVPHGYLSNVQSKAKLYCQKTGAKLLPFGFDNEKFINELANLAKSLPIQPKEVWTVAGSGTLSRALQKAWPEADFNAVQVGKAPNIGKAKLYKAPESFEKDAKVIPPFPSCSNYDAKAWQYIKRYASPDALFWNVAA